MIKLIFFGSPQNAADLLAKLDKDARFEVVAVVTQPDRPIGRKQILTPTPVAQYAEKNNIITLKPPRLPQKKHLIKNSRKLKQQIQALLNSESTLLRGTPCLPAGRENLVDYSSTKKNVHQNFPLVNTSTNSQSCTKSLANVLEKGYRGTLLDLILSYEFGQLISKEILKLPRLGALNIHFSLLPSYRGASPLAWQIANGEKETGISVVKMSTIFDQGPLIYQEKHTIKSNDTTQTLHQRLSARVLELLPDLLFNYASCNLTAYPHPKPRTLNLARKASYYPRLTRQTGYIPWKDFLLATGIKSDAFNEIESVALEIERKIRAFYPWPGVWTRIKNRRLKILSAKLENGKLVPLEVQLAGEKIKEWKNFSLLLFNLFPD